MWPEKGHFRPPSSIDITIWTGKLEVTRKLESSVRSVQVKLGSRGGPPRLEPTRPDPIRALEGIAGPPLITPSASVK